ncbi:hypothetical protein NDU88_010635 [Pleurodeles waltl]|uniref:Uncharacterized protein n=1 Tax=Pleurodeles waltl TaxID=8319 RepID=A0AAV7PYM1_PLEWA|nr:hypothetical protein NDU88_010635 [Pleurodeles waltl]
MITDLQLPTVCQPTVATSDVNYPTTLDVRDADLPGGGSLHQQSNSVIRFSTSKTLTEPGCDERNKQQSFISTDPVPRELDIDPATALVSTEVVAQPTKSQRKKLKKTHNKKASSSSAKAQTGQIDHVYIIFRQLAKPQKVAGDKREVEAYLIEVNSIKGTVDDIIKETAVISNVTKPLWQQSVFSSTVPRSPVRAEIGTWQSLTFQFSSK